MINNKSKRSQKSEVNFLLLHFFDKYFLGHHCLNMPENINNVH